MLMPKKMGAGSDEHESFNNNHVRASNHIGLHPQMVQYDPQLHDGTVLSSRRRTRISRCCGRSEFSQVVSAPLLCRSLSNRA